MLPTLRNPGSRLRRSLRRRCSCLRVWGCAPARRLLPELVPAPVRRIPPPLRASSLTALRVQRARAGGGFSDRRFARTEATPCLIDMAKSFPCVVLPLAARFMGRPILSRPCRRQGRPPSSAPPVTTPAASWLLPLDFVAHSLSRGDWFLHGYRKEAIEGLPSGGCFVVDGLQEGWPCLNFIP